MPLKSLTIILLLTLIICCSKNEPLELNRAFYIMGSSLEIKLITNDEKLFNDIVKKSINRAKEIDQLFSNYKDDSVLAKVNSFAAKLPIEVPEEFISLAQSSIEYSKITGGAFDITVGAIFELWKKNNGDVPSESDIEKALDCTGYHNIKLEGNKISFSSSCTQLDFGAIGKGYVVDQIVKIIKSHGIKKGIVNFGGNIYAIDSSKENRQWHVNITDPSNTEHTITKIALNNYGIATSGDYEKYFTIQGKNYSHIIDPKTGFPVKDISSVTVAAKTATEADVLSTAFSVLGIEKTKEFIKNRTDIAVIFITKQNDKQHIYKSELFKKFEQLRK